MKTVREKYRVTSDVWCCSDCYMAYHYGHNASEISYSEEWQRDIYIETFNTWAENGVTVTDNVCSTHETDGIEPCHECGSSDYENGITEFSKSRCQICEDHLAGSRYRLQASHLI
jgi:ribosomal protein L37AE/L43A